MFAADDARDAEVHHLDVAGGRHHQVRRLEIAMDDPGAVRVLERIEHLVAEARRPGQSSARPGAGHELLAGFAGHVLHDHQQVGALARQFMDGGDAGMLQAGQRRPLRIGTAASFRES